MFLHWKECNISQKKKQLDLIKLRYEKESTGVLPVENETFQGDPSRSLHSNSLKERMDKLGK